MPQHADSLFNIFISSQVHCQGCDEDVCVPFINYICAIVSFEPLSDSLWNLENSHLIR